MSTREARGGGARSRSTPPPVQAARRRSGSPGSTAVGGPAAGSRVAGTVRGGGTQVSDVQRVRMLRAALEIVGEVGYGGMSVARVTARAGISRRTFYDLFEDREHCFLAVFEWSVARVRAVAEDAAAGEPAWRGRVRAGLAGLLAFLEEEPTIGSLLVVDALATGSRVLEARARVIVELIGVLDQGRGEGGNDLRPPELTAEAVVGAVLAVVHARLLERDRRPLLGLLNPLMGMIVLPYLGQAAASEELARPVPKAPRRSRRSTGDPLGGLEMRLTYRTLRVLAAIAAQPQASNRLVADSAGVQDQGQISKLLGRLETLGLIANSGHGRAKGEPNAWSLTARGEEVELSLKTQAQVST
jgi:AcrR family transcriptional regulator